MQNSSSDSRFGPAVHEPDANPESEWFGYRTVEADEKTDLVRRVFGSVAPRYDLMNDLMSGGLHRLWKDHLTRLVRPRMGEACLDVAGGTGDIAFRLHKASDGEALIHVCDLNPDMVRIGRDRALDKGIMAGLDWAVGNAESLPYPDNSFDIYTIAFGLRNVTRIDTALAEAQRVLKPGGRFFCMEFSQLSTAALKRLYDFYSFQILPRMGRYVAGDEQSYQYLAESIRKFPGRDELRTRMEKAGLSRARHSTLTQGVVAIHRGWKL